MAVDGQRKTILSPRHAGRFVASPAKSALKTRDWACRSFWEKKTMFASFASGKDSAPGTLVLNRTIILRDTWAIAGTIGEAVTMTNIIRVGTMAEIMATIIK
jgi:hypothetical protein